MSGHLLVEAELRECWDDNTLTIKDIAARWGVSPTTVSNWAKKIGLPPRRPGVKSKDTDKRGSATGVKPEFSEKALALSGGHWAPDERGINRWVPDKSA